MFRQSKYVFLVIFIILSNLLAKGDKFYNYYDDGLEYMEKGDWERALSEFKTAYSLQFADKNRKRLYGTRFIRYFPHREAGICYYFLNEYDNAKNELEISISYYNSDRAIEFLSKMRAGITPDDLLKEMEDKKLVVKKEQLVKVGKIEEKKEVKDDVTVLYQAKEEKKETEDDVIVLYQAEEEKQKVVKEKVQIKIKTPLIAAQPRITRVGSPLSIAVLPFDNSGKNIHSSMISITMDKLITRLVKTRRFKIIDRGAIEKIMQEQALSMTGMVDEASAVEAGRVIGADAIIIGNMVLMNDIVKVSVRLIDVETSETIVANDVDIINKNVDRSMQKMAQMIDNDMPLVEGIIIKVDAESLILDIGSDLNLRKGTKCTVYKKGEEIIHPVTGEILGNNVTTLGEVVITQVQPKMSIAKITKEGSFSVGDGVIVK